MEQQPGTSLISTITERTLTPTPLAFQSTSLRNTICARETEEGERDFCLLYQRLSTGSAPGLGLYVGHQVAAQDCVKIASFSKRL